MNLAVQLECDAGLLSGSACSSAHYPQATAVVMQPLPTLSSMPNPCAGRAYQPVVSERDPSSWYHRN